MKYDIYHAWQANYYRQYFQISIYLNDLILSNLKNQACLDQEHQFLHQLY